MKSLQSFKFSKDKFLILAFSVFVFLGLLQQVINLGDIVPFHDWDEAIYMQVAKEFVKSPSILLTYNGQPWFEKPPLPTIAYSIPWLLPLKRELTARLISLLFSLSSLFVLYKILTDLKLSKRLSLIAIFVTIQSAMYRDRSELVNVDIMLSLGWLLYLYGSTSKNIWLKAIGTITGTLSKSLLGFIPLLLDIASHVVTMKITKRKILEWFLLLFSGSVWHAFMVWRYGGSFIQSHFMDHLVSRVTRPIELHFGDKWYYLAKVFGETHIFAIMGVLGMAFVIYRLLVSHWLTRSFPKNTRDIILIISIPVAYITLLTLSKSKLHWYVTPLIPFVGMWVALGLNELTKIQSRWSSKISSSAFLFIAVFSGYIFATSVTSIQSDWFTPTDKTIIGICVGKSSASGDTITYLLPPQERIDANVIEAANLQIGSSFIYGSAPAFLYYADKPVSFVYKEGDLATKIKNSNIIVVPVLDLNNQKTKAVISTWLGKEASHTQMLCETDSLVAYRKDMY